MDNTQILDFLSTLNGGQILGAIVGLIVAMKMIGWAFSPRTNYGCPHLAAKAIVWRNGGFPAQIREVAAK